MTTLLDLARKCRTEEELLKLVLLSAREAEVTVEEATEAVADAVEPSDDEEPIEETVEDIIEEKAPEQPKPPSRLRNPFQKKPAEPKQEAEVVYKLE